jgi:TIR domain
VSNPKEFVKDLASRLSKEGYEVWDPDWEVLPGDNLPLKIGEALKQADVMIVVLSIVVLSPEAVESRRIRHEIEYAFRSSNYGAKIRPQQRRHL